MRPLRDPTEARPDQESNVPRGICIKLDLHMYDLTLITTRARLHEQDESGVLGTQAKTQTSVHISIQQT